jgi:hypothetical protein
VSNQQVRGPEALLIFEVVRNDGLAGPQSIAGRRLQIGPDTCHADDTLAPAYPGPNQKAALRRYVFHDFAVFGTEPFGRYACGLIKHAGEARALKRKHAQFGKEFLLTDTLPKSAGGQLVGLIIAWRRLDDRLFLVG